MTDTDGHVLAFLLHQNPPTQHNTSQNHTFPPSLHSQPPKKSTDIRSSPALCGVMSRNMKVSRCCHPKHPCHASRRSKKIQRRRATSDIIRAWSHQNIFIDWLALTSVAFSAAESACGVEEADNKLDQTRPTLPVGVSKVCDAAYDIPRRYSNVAIGTCWSIWSHTLPVSWVGSSNLSKELV